MNDYIGTATYSPEDNKLRLYPDERLPKDLYERVRSAGFKWAPKQELFVAPKWTPSREDLLLELCGEIEDEDCSALERSADRAERFAGYRDKRRAEAHGHADTFDAGPDAFGHQNRQRAERQAMKHDRNRTRAVSQWSKAEYWQTRTKAVIEHAERLDSPHVRRGRILKLEAEQRKHESGLEKHRSRFELWNAVLRKDGADECVNCSENKYGNGATSSPAAALAYALANTGGAWGYIHPRTGKESSLYSHLTDSVDPITAREAAELWLADAPDPDDENSLNRRWSKHYELRLQYENAMLEAEGGKVSEVDIEPGGFIRLNSHYRRTMRAPEWSQIVKVNKSRATGRVVSVHVLGSDPYLNDHTVKPRKVNIERLGEDSYRAPTDEERQAFSDSQKKAKRKPVSLLNPTDDDAKRLMRLWASLRGDGKPVREVTEMEQKQYSYLSKGDSVRTVGIDEDGRHANFGKPAVFKIRTKFSFHSYSDSVVVLTDKPRKSLPLDWDRLESPQVETGKVVTA